MAKIQANRVYAELQRAKENGFTTVSEQGSSRSGKTYNTVIWLVATCLAHERTTVSVVRQTLPALRRSVLRDFIEVLSLIGTETSFNRSELIVTFKNGSMIEFFSADNEAKLRGSKRQILYVNEANELSFIEWQQLQMRTTQFSIIDYNPSFGDNHWICSLNKESNTYHFITTYKDNPFLEQKVIDEIESLKWKNRSLWEVYGLGKQAIIEGLVFENVSIIEDIPSFCRKKSYLGVDFGYSHDPTAIVEVCIYNGTIYVDEWRYRTRMLTSDIIDALKEKNRQSKREFKVISESADPRLIDEIYNSGIDIHPVKKFAGSIMAGIQKMQEFHIEVTRQSASVIKEFKNYAFRQDKEGRWLNEPAGGLDHAIDAIRYVILEEVLGENNNGLTAEELADLL